MAPTPDELRKELFYLGQYIKTLQERFADLDNKIAEFESQAAAQQQETVQEPVQEPVEIYEAPEQEPDEAPDSVQICVRCNTPRRGNALFCAECGMQYSDEIDAWDPVTESHEPEADTPAASEAFADMQEPPEIEPAAQEETPAAQAPEQDAVAAQTHEDEIQEAPIPAPEPETEAAPVEEDPAQTEQVEDADPKEAPQDLDIQPEPAIAAFAETQEPETPAMPPDQDQAPLDAPVRLRESDIGAKWFGIAGIVLVVVAFAFFVKYAMDSGWIGPLLRVAGGVLIGACVVGLGAWFDKRQAFKGYARILIGGGFALIYFAIFAAYYFYNDSIAITQAADLALLTATVAGAIWFSVRMDSLVLAAEAFLLGYVTAYLGGVITVFTLSYNVVLALGLVYLVWRKGWFSLGVAGLAATYIMHIFWLQANLDKSLTNMVFLLCYFAMFAAVGIAEQHFVARTGSGSGKPALPSESRYLLYAVAALNLFLPVTMAPRDDIFLVYYLAADLAVFVMALQFSMAGLGLCAVGVNYFAFVLWHNAHGANTGLAILFLVCIYTGFTLYGFMLRSMQRRLPFEEVITVFVNTFCFFALLFKKISGDYSDWAGLFTLAMGALNLGLCKLAARRTDNTLRDSYLVIAVVFLTLAIPVQLTKTWLPLSWAAESVALVYLSFKLNNAILRQLSRAVAVIAFASLFPIDIFHAPLGLVFVIVTASCYFMRAWLYHRHLLKPGEINGEFLETCAYALVAAGLVLAYIAFLDQALWIRYAGACAWGAALLGAGIALRLYWLHPAALFVHAAVLISTAYSYGTGEWSATAVLLPQVITYAVCFLPLKNARAPRAFEDYRIAGYVYEFAGIVLLTGYLWFMVNVRWLPAAWAAESVILLFLCHKLNDAMMRQLSRAVAVLAILSLFSFGNLYAPMSLALAAVTSGCFFIRAWLTHSHLTETEEINRGFLEICAYALVAAGVVLTFIACLDQALWIRYAGACAWGAALLGAGIALRLYWLHPAALFVHAAVLISTAYSYGTGEWSATAVLLPQLITYAVCSLPLITGLTPKAFEDYKYAGYAYELAAAALLTVYLWFIVHIQWLPAAWAAESVVFLLLSFAGSRVMRRLYGQIAAVLALAGIAQLVAGPAADIPWAASLAAAGLFFARAWIYHAHVFKRQQLDRAFVETYAYAMAGAMFVYLLIGNLANGAWALSAGQCAWALLLVAAGAALRLYWLQIAGLTLNIILLASAYPDLANHGDAPLAVLLPRVLILYAATAIHARQNAAPPFEALRQGAAPHAAAATALLTIMLALVFSGHWVSIAWAAEAVAIIVAGVALKHRIVRYSGIGLFVLTLGKVMILDMASLDVGYRVISLFGVGLLLLIASYLYYRFRDRIEDLL